MRERSGEAFQQGRSVHEVRRREAFGVHAVDGREGDVGLA
jgi:hypothetical protein